MNEFMNKLNQRTWEYDIASFDRSKELYYKYPDNETVKRITLRRMGEIQAKYPQYIKTSEIPE